MKILLFHDCVNKWGQENFIWRILQKVMLTWPSQFGLAEEPRTSKWQTPAASQKLYCQSIFLLWEKAKKEIAGACRSSLGDDGVQHNECTHIYGHKTSLVWKFMRETMGNLDARVYKI